MKRRLRVLLAISSVPPLDALYRGLYRLVARLAALVLRRRRGVSSLYLTRGVARGAITPGVSDIDFIVITRDESALPAVRSAGRALQRATAGLVEYYPNFAASRATVERRWRTTPAWQYRLHEGRRTWKLVAGEDLLATLAPLSPERLSTACYLELCRWWTVFARLLVEGAHERDRVLRNATCYKVTSELLLVDHFRRTGERRASRDEALAADGSPFAARLAGIAAGRFLADEPAIVEETSRFLFGFFTALWRSFATRPFLELRPGVAQELEAPSARGDAAADGPPRELASFEEFALRQWGADCRAVHWLGSAFWNDDARLLVVDGDAGRPPSAEQLAALVREHGRRWPAPSPQVDLVLRLGPIGFPLTPRIPRDLHRGLLTPATTPDVFLQLGGREVYWTDFTAWYLGDWRDNEQWLDAPEATRRRLESLAAAAAGGKIVYPRTPDTRDSARDRDRAADREVRA